MSEPTNGSSERLDRIERLLDRLAERDEQLTQRDERLAERHETLAQTVEIIAGMQRENEARHAKNEKLLAEVIDSIHSLARIAESHERRLDDLEGAQ
jgi:hypothetical protein